ncbi:septal ring lytic transglycosylase RlpA family protein [Helicobacter mehlei]|uniref:Probable endolytic peptidoglycan transglycosylase RlpA n=1 Tax=Helicobacter mehlei TaxID=2316080 RepID=A0A553V3N2_9HELI|nr:septal ring lytic transglycosylase RlpA family protein [Helicobacter mehlei]
MVCVLFLASCKQTPSTPRTPPPSAKSHESLWAYKDARNFGGARSNAPSYSPNTPAYSNEPYSPPVSQTPSRSYQPQPSFHTTPPNTPSTPSVSSTPSPKPPLSSTPPITKTSPSAPLPPTTAKVTPRSLTGGMIDSEAMQRATMRPYKVGGKTYYPTKVAVGQTFDGYASWYGPNFHARKTSNGETYNMYAHTAAHKTLPMNTIVKVTNKDNNKSTIVRINDRGPFVPNRIIDLSNIAARDIEMVGKGVAPVKLQVLGFGGVVSKQYAKTLNIPQNHTLQKEFKVGPTQQSYSGGEFSLQMGAFRNKEGALKAQRNWQAKLKKGHKIRMVEGIKDNQPIYRVFISGFKSEEEANDYAKHMSQPTILVRE